jgi:hypothetical protein
MVDPERAAVEPTCGPPIDRLLKVDFELEGDEIELDANGPDERELRTWPP